MVYLPPHFTETRPDVLIGHIERHDFGLLVTHGADGIESSQIPFLVERRGEQIRLQGHLARPNPQVAAPTIPNTDPTIEPNRRPWRCISNAAGNTHSITPRCCIVIGSVARSRTEKNVTTESAVAVNIIVFADCPMAWQQTSRNRFLLIAGVKRRFIGVDASMGAHLTWISQTRQVHRG